MILSFFTSKSRSNLSLTPDHAAGIVPSSKTKLLPENSMSFFLRLSGLGCFVFSQRSWSWGVKSFSKTMCLFLGKRDSQLLGIKSLIPFHARGFVRLLSGLLTLLVRYQASGEWGTTSRSPSFLPAFSHWLTLDSPRTFRQNSVFLHQFYSGKRVWPYCL